MHTIWLSVAAAWITLSLASPINENVPSHVRLVAREENPEPPPPRTRSWGQYEFCLAASQEEPVPIPDAARMNLQKRADPVPEPKLPPKLMHIDEYFKTPQLREDLLDPFAGMSKEERAWKILEEGCLQGAAMLGQTPKQRYYTKQQARDAGILQFVAASTSQPRRLAAPSSHSGGRGNFFSGAFNSIKDRMMPYFVKPGASNPRGGLTGVGSSRPLIGRPMPM